MSKNGHKNGSVARNFETLVPIMALFEASNVEILVGSQPATLKRLHGKSSPEFGADLYSLWDRFEPPILGKTACYARKNIIEPINDAFDKPFPTRVVVGPGTQQLILGSRGDCANKWSNLGNCAAKELAKRKSRQKFTRQVTPAGAAQLAKIAREMGQLLPASVVFKIKGKKHTAKLPDDLKDHVKQQEQFCQLRHALTMVFKGGLPPKKNLHPRFFDLLPEFAENDLYDVD